MLYKMHYNLGGVYMRKVSPARVSYRDDFLISYRVYLMTESRGGGGGGGRDEVWDRETMFSQLAKRSPCVMASG